MGTQALQSSLCKPKSYAALSPQGHPATMNLHMVVNVPPEPFGQDKCFELKTVSNKSNAYSHH